MAQWAKNFLPNQVEARFRSPDPIQKPAMEVHIYNLSTPGTRREAGITRESAEAHGPANLW